MPSVIKGDSNVNLDFSTGGRITGDFSNATFANRVSFQTNTANGVTGVQALPNGTSQTSTFDVYNAADPTNASFGQLQVNASDVRVVSNIRGTGSYLPMTFYTGGSERMRVDTSGNVGIGKTPSQKLDVAGRGDFTISSPGIVQNWNDTSSNNIQVGTTTDGLYIANTANKAVWFATNGSERMRIDSSGRVTIPYQPAFYAAGLTTGAYTGGQLVNFSSAPLNRGSYFNTGSNRFTAPVSGVYVFCLGIYVWDNTATSNQSFAIRVNGSEIALSGDITIFFSGALAGGDNMVMGSLPILLNQGDYVTINLRTGAPTLKLYSGHSFFSGYLLG